MWAMAKKLYEKERLDCRGFSNRMRSSRPLIRSGITSASGFVTDRQEPVTNGPLLAFILWIHLQKKEVAELIRHLVKFRGETTKGE